MITAPVNPIDALLKKHHTSSTRLAAALDRPLRAVLEVRSGHIGRPVRLFEAIERAGLGNAEELLGDYVAWRSARSAALLAGLGADADREPAPPAGGAEADTARPLIESPPDREIGQGA